MGSSYCDMEGPGGGVTSCPVLPRAEVVVPLDMGLSVMELGQSWAIRRVGHLGFDHSPFEWLEALDLSHYGHSVTFTE